MCVVKSKSYIQWTSYTNLSGTLDIQYKFVWYNDNHIQNCAVQTRRNPRQKCAVQQLLKSYTNLCGTNFEEPHTKMCDTNFKEIL